MFALSLHPVGWALHNEFIASVCSTTFGLDRKCLKIDKLTTSKEIPLPENKFLQPQASENNEKNVR